MHIRHTLGVSLAVTAAIWLVLAYRRANIVDPFDVDIFRHLLFYQDYYAALAFAGILVGALLPPVRAAGAWAAGWCGRHAVAASLATAALLAACAPLVYHGHPLSMDEYGPLWQSKVFVEGRLDGQYPAQLLDWLIPPGFRDVFFKADVSGAVVSMYWPGFALLLAPFTALGAPWMLNPLIGGATVLVVHRLAKALVGSEAAAGYAVLLTVASPAVTINALSYYSWSAHLLANGCFALLLLNPSAPRALAAGLIGSLALVLHNPVPHLLFALPWIVWLALRPDAPKLLAALGAGYLPLVLLLGFGWRMHVRTLDSALAVGDLANPAGMLHTFWQTVKGTLQLPSIQVLVARLWGLAKLWLWAAPGLVVAALYGAWLCRRADVRWRVLAASAVLTYLGYFLFRYDQGHGWGYRYFHSAWLVLPLFAAAVGNRATRGYLAACALLSLALMTGLRAVQVEGFIGRHLEQLPPAGAGQARVVIVDAAKGYYAQDLVQNDPFLRDRVLVLASRGAAADEAMMRKLFPGLSRLSSSERGTTWGHASR